MPDAFENVDALGWYLTGAGSDGGAQPDPLLSLGGFRSASEVPDLGFLVSSSFPNIRVDRVTGDNGKGFAALRATDNTSVAYTPPGGSEGVAVAIADGETKLIEGSNRNKAIRVTRTTDEVLEGSPSIDVEGIFNGGIGFRNVTNAERVAGLDNYWALMLRLRGTRNMTSGSVYICPLSVCVMSDVAQLGGAGAGTLETSGSLGTWPEKGWVRIEDSGGFLREIAYYDSRTDQVLNVTIGGYRGRLGTTAAAGAASDCIYPVPGIRIGQEVPIADEIQTIANDETEPGGVTWNTGITPSTGLQVGALAPGDNLGLWFHREIPASAVVAERLENCVHARYFLEN